jgi:hypothetical protein
MPILESRNRLAAAPNNNRGTAVTGPLSINNTIGAGGLPVVPAAVPRLPRYAKPTGVITKVSTVRLISPPTGMIFRIGP